MRDNEMMKSDQERGLSPEDEKRVIALNKAISSVVLGLCKRRGLTQKALAEKMGYTRTSLNFVLKSRSMQRLWKLQYLMLAAEALGVSVTDIVSAAEGVLPCRLNLEVAQTEERSPERLERILRYAAGSDESNKELDDLAFSSNRFKWTCTGVYKDYIAGVLSDEELLRLLKASFDKAANYPAESDSDYKPFWAFLNEDR